MRQETPYQARYLAHQARKRAQITESIGEKPKPHGVPLASVMKVLEHRRSQRLFSGAPVSEKQLEIVLKAACTAPNSCNRHGIRIHVVSDRREKELLGGILVGGVGWIHRADKVLLLLADPIAYASPNEKDFMHFCDAGFVAMAMWLAAEAQGLGACYINPNIGHPDVFRTHFGMVPMKGGSREHIFCGALVLGNYEKRVLKAERVAPSDILL